MKPIPILALFAALSTGPALAQDYPRYPADQPDTTSRVQVIPESEQEARMPDAEQHEPGEIETLRSDSMSSPNVWGETTPEDPATGLPQPGANPRQIETLPRP
jgi:hypothetical protein